MSQDTQRLWVHIALILTGLGIVLGFLSPDPWPGRAVGVIGAVIAVTVACLGWWLHRRSSTQVTGSDESLDTEAHQSSARDGR